GHRLRRSIALAYLRSDVASEGGAVEIEIFGRRRPAIIMREPLYDAANERLKG
ncbi:MAG: hypothetical protein JO010_06125, partial [Alphaproteobacteria bacterium]|nr:hypothetical protein [Alphaproteobacteria bacterium]